LIFLIDKARGVAGSRRNSQRTEQVSRSFTFLISHCNLLLSWLLRFIRWADMANRRNTLRFRARGSTKSSYVRHDI